MNSKHIVTLVCAAAFCGGVHAASPEAEPEEKLSEWTYEPGAGLSFAEQPIVSAEFSIAWDSKYLSYGLVDNNDPIITPAGYLTFFDWITVGVSAIYDTTKYGEGAGYHNRAWMYTEVDPEVSIGHTFSNEEFNWIPVGLGSIEWSVGYMYESHPQSSTGPCEEDCDDWEDPDTQFVTFDFGLPDLWLEPAFSYEKDFMRDHGTYLNASIGHTFALVDGEEEDDDPILTLRPSVAQGWGDRRRVAGYLCDRDEEPLERNALMDSAFKLELAWQICDYLALSGYVQYSDYLFDRHAREASRRYEAKGDHRYSHNFTTGLCLTASF